MPIARSARSATHCAIFLLAGAPVCLATTAHDDSSTARARLNGVACGDAGPNSEPASPPTWETRAPAPLALREAPTAVVGGRYYVFSGFLNGLLISASTTSYDPATDTWRADHAPMPLPVTHVPVVAVGSEVWVLGGFAGDHPGTSTDRVQVYDAAADRWRDGPTLPTPMASHAAALLGRKIHAFGGLRPDRQTDVGHHYVLDLDNLAAGWRPAAALPNARNHLSAASAGGRVYAIGGQYGHDDGRQMTALLHAYDPDTDTWTRRANLLTPKSHFEPGTDAFDGRIIIVGGDLGRPQQTSQIDLYNTLTNRWERQPSLPEPLNAPGARVMGDLLVVSHGGNGGGHYDRTRARAQARYPSAALGFSLDTLRLSDADAGRPAEVLLWTLSGEAVYSIRKSTNAGWLEVLNRTGLATPTAAEVGIRVSPEGLDPGTYAVTLTATAPGYTAAKLRVVLTVGEDAPGAVARINAGGPAVAAGGEDWLADAFFEGGRDCADTAVTEIAGTDADVLYLTCRTATARGVPFSYHVPVPEPGRYGLRLHFAEIYWGAPGGGPGGTGRRVFDVVAEGQTILDDYDITRDVGPLTAVVKAFEVGVADGALDLTFTASVDRPMVAAIEVLRAPAAFAASASAAVLPTTFAVGAPAPNPSASGITLRLDLPEDAGITVALYDVLGRRVRESSSVLSAGAGQALRLDLQSAAPGVYVYHVRAEMARGAAVAFGRLTVAR